jgi:hypothetical protein
VAKFHYSESHTIFETENFKNLPQAILKF